MYLFVAHTSCVFSCSCAERSQLIVRQALSVGIFSFLVCRTFSVARASGVFSCSCVVRFGFLCVKGFLLLMCRTFSVVRVSCVFVSLVSGAFGCSGVLCFQSLVCRAFFHLWTSVFDFFVLGARSARVPGGKAVRESFAGSVRATCALVTCVSYAQASNFSHVTCSAF